MTEQQLRQKVVNTARGWLGRRESDGSHRAIIDLYNAHTPLARGYQVQYTDAWCATFVSAVAIKCGLADIMPLECGCGGSGIGASSSLPFLKTKKTTWFSCR